MYKYQIINKDTNEVIFNNRIPSDTEQLAQEAGDTKRRELSLSEVMYEVVTSEVVVTNFIIKRGKETLENHDCLNHKEMNEIDAKYGNEPLKSMLVIMGANSTLSNFMNNENPGSLVVELI